MICSKMSKDELMALHLKAIRLSEMPASGPGGVVVLSADEKALHVRLRESVLAWASALVVLLVFASLVDAGPFRRGRRNYEPRVQPTVSVAVDVVSASADPYLSNFPLAKEVSADDALDEVNAQRRARGLRPFIKDDGLTLAARACAKFRADRGMHGHTSNDFVFLPPGASATAAGAEGDGWTVGMGWGTCCMYDDYTYAGAGVEVRGNLRFMHLFVR
jgi:hypothetical protein